MTWTYSGDPQDTPKDAVRFWVGDTTEGAPQLSDEEIAYLLTLTGGSVVQAAIAGCIHLSNRYSSQVDFAVESELKVNLSQRAQAYADRAQELRQQSQMPGLGTVHAQPYAGGVSRSDMERQEQAADRVPPAFVVGLMSEAGTDPARRGARDEEDL